MLYTRKEDNLDDLSDNIYLDGLICIAKFLLGIIACFALLTVL